MPPCGLPSIAEGETRWSRSDVLGLRINAVNLPDAARLITNWAIAAEARYICLANVHMTMASFDDPLYRSTVNGSDLTLPDGLPLVWASRLGGLSPIAQVRGTDLLRAICAAAENAGVRVGLLGSTPCVLSRMKARLRADYPMLKVTMAHSPPFTALSGEAQAALLGEIAASGTQILFVGLGCPKQERWMRDAVRYCPVTMVGVGAAFGFIAGDRREAPRILQRLGLEWLMRFASEPLRLWRRYLLYNPRFVLHAGLQIVRERVVARTA